jgi:ribosome-associated protein
MKTEDSAPDDQRPSKTRRKQEMHGLQDIGAELVALSSGQLRKLDLPENLLDAVLDYQRFPKHEAQRRQLQYIGRLMRNIDPEPIAAGLAELRGDSAAATARLHRLERLRERFLEDEQVLQEIAADYPGADLAQLRQLRRNTLKEREQAKPPKHFRAIFQVFKELEDARIATAEAATGDASPD